jgi:hypothetical protein
MTTSTRCPSSSRTACSSEPIDIDEQNRSVPPIESIPKTGMTGSSNQGPRRSHGAGRRSHGAEPHFALSMQAICEQ